MQKVKLQKRKKLRTGLLLTLMALVLVPLVSYMIYHEVRGKVDLQKTPEGFELIIPGIDVNALILDGEQVWAGGLAGLYFSDEQGYRKVGKFHYVKALLQDPEGGIWVGHDDGLSFVTLKRGSEEDWNTGQTKDPDIEFTIKTYTTADGLPDNRVNALAFSPRGDLLIGSWGGLTTFKNGQFENTDTMENGLIDNMVNTIFFDREDNLWLGSYVAPRGGITVLPVSGNPQQFPGGRDGVVHPNIIATIEPVEGYIISGGGLFTKGGGNVFSMQGGSWQIRSDITMEDGVPGEKIRSLFFDASTKELWVGTEYDGLVIFKDFTIKEDGKISYSDSIILSITNGLPNNEIKVIIKAADDAFWIGSRSGLLKINKGGLKNVRDNQ